MSASVGSSTPMSAQEVARRRRTLPGAGGAGGTQATPTLQPVGTVAAQQAQQGAQQAQPVAEAFNAPRIVLPDSPSTLQVMDGLARAMADPSVNKTTAQALFSLHEQLMAAEKAMTQAIIDGMLV